MATQITAIKFSSTNNGAHRLKKITRRYFGDCLMITNVVRVNVP